MRDWIERLLRAILGEEGSLFGGPKRIRP